MNIKNSQTHVVDIVDAKKLNPLLSLLFFVVFSFSSFAQGYVDYNVENKEGLSKAEPGTYQIIIILPKGEPVFTTEILYFIEKNRLQDKDQVISLSPNVDLYIPSKAKIESPDFELLEEFQK